MDREGLRPRTRRKLNKAQIIEILERNVALYKDEENFVRYLVDLAIYLMEYEYDGSDSANNTTASMITGSTTGHDLPPAPAPAGAGLNGKINSRVTNQALLKNLQPCPYCGTIVGDLVICPSCRNVTR